MNFMTLKIGRGFLLYYQLIMSVKWVIDKDRILRWFSIFMDPCIVVWLSRNNQQDATL
jgi:hypothetical protein